jgi:molybdate transport system ATP-binding protein
MSAAPMKWSVAIRRTMSDAAHTFELDVSFSSRATRLVLFGPSGAGKTLTLKAIAGLLRPDAGSVVFDDETLFDAARGIDVPSRERRLGYVFQEYALFPHLTVRQNVAFGLGKGWRNPGRRGVDPAAERWLEALELGALGDRFPDQISGGQRQRTALARALAAEPRALLFDEPFAAMDVALRDRLRAELRELQARFALPILLITHDAADVEAFADEVIHIDAGRVVQQASRPQESSVKTSARNQLAGTVRGVKAGAVNDEIEIELAGGQRIVAIVTHESAASLGLMAGAAAFALVKASSVIVVADPGTARLSARNQLAGKVTRIQPGAVNAEVLIDVGGSLTIAAIVTQESASSMGLAAGSPATAIFKASSVIVGVPS